VTFLDTELQRYPERTFLTEIKAEVLFDAGDQEGAFALAKEQQVAHPESPGPLLLLARLQELANDSEAAQATLEAAKASHPTEPNVLEALVSYHVRHENMESASTLMQQAPPDTIGKETWVDLAERLRLANDLYSCVEIGTGQPSTEDPQDYEMLGSMFDGVYEPDYFTANNVQRGFVANHCRRTTVDVRVWVTFTVKEVVQVWIMTETKLTKDTRTITLRGIEPGEVRSFRGAVGTSSAEFGEYMSVRSSVVGIKVGAKLLAPQFQLRP
jgi:hypothetical protein